MEYTWDFTEVEVYPTMTKDGVEYSDVLHTIHWTYTASEGDDSQTHIDRLELDLSDMTGFVPYSELTRETVILYHNCANSMFCLETAKLSNYHL